MFQPFPSIRTITELQVNVNDSKKPRSVNYKIDSITEIFLLEKQTLSKYVYFIYLVWEKSMAHV